MSHVEHPSETPNTRLRYKEYSPHIEVSFWYELERRKLHEWRLDEEKVPLTLFGALHASSSAPPANAVSLRRESLGNDAAAIAATFPLSLHNKDDSEDDISLVLPTLIRGRLLNFNTVEQLQRLPRREALWQALQEELLTPLTKSDTNSSTGHSTHHDEEDDDESMEAEKNWIEANYAIAALFTFADLKRHVFHYALAFPVLDLGSPLHVVRRVTGEDAVTGEEKGDGAPHEGAGLYFPSRAALDALHAHLLTSLREHPERGPNPCLVVRSSDAAVGVTFIPLTPRGLARAEATRNGRLLLAMVDVSTLEDAPSWSARNMIAMIRLARPSTVSVALYCFRHADARRSVLFDCTCDPLDFTLTNLTTLNHPTESHHGGLGKVRVVGWAASGLRSIDLSSMMEPMQLADSSARLNLGLMKWRMMPDLRLDGLARCRALILGSGTLGCNVARHLLMWGVTHITLVDRGNVSYSNPVRQTLFEMADVVHPREEERNKAVAAARALRRILPTVRAEGIALTIHMPGHRIDAAHAAQAAAEIERLDELIQQHDVVFLLTDSREARWLPTLMAATHDKPVLNAALAFDTYVVMRHGVKVRAEKGKRTTAQRLGCYFCSDVVAPRDSMTARTLDQQCTVTRPGVSGMASATAVELLAQLYNHPLGFACPPYMEGKSHLCESGGNETNNAKGSDHDQINNMKDDKKDEEEKGEEEEGQAAVCVLGNIPQQIRGSVSGHYIYTLHGFQYDLCTACSDAVQEAYHTQGIDFVMRCINDPIYIEEISGVKAFKEKCNLEDYGEWEIDSSTDLRLEEEEEKGEKGETKQPAKK